MEIEVKPGKIVYFKTVKFVPHDGKKKDVEFQGHGYGVFLGHVPLGMPGPPLDIALASLGSCGFIRFDDVREFAGEEVMNTLLTKWQVKYTERISALAREAVASGKIRIVGADGKPLIATPGLQAVPELPVAEDSERVPLKIADDGTVTEIGKPAEL